MWWIESYDKVNKIWHRYGGEYKFTDAMRIISKLKSAGWKCRIRKANTQGKDGIF